LVTIFAFVTKAIDILVVSFLPGLPTLPMIICCYVFAKAPDVFHAMITSNLVYILATCSACFDPCWDTADSHSKLAGCSIVSSSGRTSQKTHSVSLSTTAITLENYCGSLFLERSKR
jgi:hypothetical protein